VVEKGSQSKYSLTICALRTGSLVLTRVFQ
jgi:hypothetical protein